MEGLIMKSTGSWYDILGADRNKYKGRLQGKFKTHGLKVTNPIAVGDKVTFQTEDVAENTVIITDIHPRENYLIRKSSHKTAFGHIIASNLDQSILVVTLVYPKTSLGFIDRFLVSCEAFGIPAVLIFNKADLYDEALEEYQNYLIEIYEKLNYKCLVTSLKENRGIDDVQSLLKGKISLLSGHSGVGKSSFINAILPELNLKTAEVSNFSSKGTHTTTFAEMFQINDNTFIIDTPGIKELGIFEIGEEELSHYFPEMRSLINECKFNNCKHINEPGCAVLQKVEQGEISISRYESYISMMMDEDNRR
ncbi:MAG: ribosome small subunit-dependent GTPase A [Cytophagaceae bacterium]